VPGGQRSRPERNSAYGEGHPMFGIDIAASYGLARPGVLAELDKVEDTNKAERWRRLAEGNGSRHSQLPIFFLAR